MMKRKQSEAEKRIDEQRELLERLRVDLAEQRTDLTDSERFRDLQRVTILELRADVERLTNQNEKLRSENAELRGPEDQRP